MIRLLKKVFRTSGFRILSLFTKLIVSPFDLKIVISVLFIFAEALKSNASNLQSNFVSDRSLVLLIEPLF